MKMANLSLKLKNSTFLLSKKIQILFHLEQLFNH